MSRSQYAWLVVREDDHYPRAVFTVKYECEFWLSRHTLDPVKVCRMRDGHHNPSAEPVWLDRETLKPINRGPAPGSKEKS